MRPRLGFATHTPVARAAAVAVCPEEKEGLVGVWFKCRCLSPRSFGCGARTTFFATRFASVDDAIKVSAPRRAAVRPLDPVRAMPRTMAAQNAPLSALDESANRPLFTPDGTDVL